MADMCATTQQQTRITAQTIVETVEHPEFRETDLEKLRQQIIADGNWLDKDWNNGTAVLYLRCETYPQCTKLTAALHNKGIKHPGEYFGTEQTKATLATATPEQLVQALKQEQQHPGGRAPTDDILRYATVEQLTGPVIEQLEWGPRLAWVAAVDTDANGPEKHRQWHVIDHIRQHLLDGDETAWAAYQQIAVTGHRIGDTVLLVNTVTQHKTLQHADTAAPRNKT